MYQIFRSFSESDKLFHFETTLVNPLAELAQSQ